MYIQYSQIPDMYEVEHCSWTGISREVSYAQSSATLESQSSSSSHGYDQEISIGVGVNDPGIDIPAETTIRNALIFGNSRTSTKQSIERNTGYEYTFGGTASRDLYSLEVGYIQFSADDYMDDFRGACASLGTSPDSADIVGFFQEYGTHGLQTASFGQKCTSSAFMQGGSSISSYSSFNREMKDDEVTLLWWTSTASSEQADSQSSSTSYGFETRYGNKHCVGQLKTNTSCGNTMRGNGAPDSPVIVKWTYKPIWEMNVPELTASAKSEMKKVFEGFM